MFLWHHVTHFFQVTTINKMSSLTTDLIFLNISYAKGGFHVETIRFFAFL